MNTEANQHPTAQLRFINSDSRQVEDAPPVIQTVLWEEIRKTFRDTDEFVVRFINVDRDLVRKATFPRSATACDLYDRIRPEIGRDTKFKLVWLSAATGERGGTITEDTHKPFADISMRRYPLEVAIRITEPPRAFSAAEDTLVKMSLDDAIEFATKKLALLNEVQSVLLDKQKYVDGINNFSVALTDMSDALRSSINHYLVCDMMTIHKLAQTSDTIDSVGKDIVDTMSKLDVMLAIKELKAVRAREMELRVQISKLPPGTWVDMQHWINPKKLDE